MASLIRKLTINCPLGSHFGILYGFAKVHKQLVNNCPPFRPTLSAIGTPAYNIAKFLAPIVKPLTTNMGCVPLPDWLRKKRCVYAVDTFDDNVCIALLSNLQAKRYKKRH